MAPISAVLAGALGTLASLPGGRGPGAGDSRSEMSDVRRVWHPAAPRLMPSAAASSTRFTDTEAAGPEPQQALGSLQVVPVWNPGSLRCHSSRPLPGELCMGGHAAC